LYKSKKEFDGEMKKLIRRVLNGESPKAKTDAENEIMGECIKRGYLIGTEGRTDDGKQHASLTADVVPYAAFAFLAPDRTNLKSNIALIISAIALIDSLFVDMRIMYENFEWAFSPVYSYRIQMILSKLSLYIPQILNHLTKVSQYFN